LVSAGILVLASGELVLASGEPRGQRRCYGANPSSNVPHANARAAGGVTRTGTPVVVDRRGAAARGSDVSPAASRRISLLSVGSQAAGRGGWFPFSKSAIRRA
jgi:hypothetical protein